MAYFAELDNDNKVIRVLVTDDSLPAKGKLWLESELGGTWIETSKTEEFRHKFASPGAVYLPEKDCFVSPQPFESWTLDEVKLEWVAPVAMPDDGQDYIWDEDSLNWALFE